MILKRIRHARQDDGFTLLELLMVIAVLGLLIAFVAPAALRQLSGARNSVAKQQIGRLESVLDLYKRKRLVCTVGGLRLAGVI